MVKIVLASQQFYFIKRNMISRDVFYYEVFDLFIFRNWKKQLDRAKSNGNSKPSLLKALVASFWPEYLHIGILNFLQSNILNILQPIILGKLLNYFKPSSVTTKDEALLYAGAVVGLNVVNLMLGNHYSMGIYHCGMKVRAACCALVYRKVSRILQFTPVVI